MSELERFEAAARCARSEPIPRLDVTARVLARIRRIEASRQVDMPLVAMSGLSVLAASIMLTITIRAWTPLLDPMAGLFSSLTMVVMP